MVTLNLRIYGINSDLLSSHAKHNTHFRQPMKHIHFTCALSPSRDILFGLDTAITFLTPKKFPLY